MNNRNVILVIGAFVVHLLLQVLVFKDIVMFNVAFCFIYVGFLLLLPFEMNNMALVVIGFIAGITVDIFYDSLGIHASATVFMMFIRGQWVKLITPRGGYEVGAAPTIKAMGFQWFSGYVLPLLFLHQFVLFFVEASGFGLFFFTISKVLSSTIFTFIVLVLGQYLFYTKKASA